MKISFESDHTHGRFDDGALTVRVKKGMDDGEIVSDQISFEVPPHFQVHNDCVAACLMTLCGTKYDEVDFNFPISTYCADVLRNDLKLGFIGPVDKTLEPRRQGQQLGLNFSGGFDSLAAHLLLDGQAKLISCDFGGGFDREAKFFRTFAPDAVCKTDIRLKGYNRNHWAFMGAASVLLADHLDLGHVTFGGVLEAAPYYIGNTIRSHAPAKTALFGAAGLNEIHVIRGLTEFGTAQVVMNSAPELAEASLTSLADPTTEKYYRKKLILRHLYDRAGQALPAYLESPVLPKQKINFGENINVDFLSVFFVKKFGVEFWSQIVGGLEQLDWSFVNGLSLDLYLRYNTNFAYWIPLKFRNTILQALHRNGIYPYDEKDWSELNQIRVFLGSARMPQIAVAASSK